MSRTSTAVDPPDRSCTSTPVATRAQLVRLGGKIVTVDPSDSKPSNVCLAGWDAHSVADACSSLESATRSLPCRGVVGVEANRRPVPNCCNSRSRSVALIGLEVLHITV